MKKAMECRVKNCSRKRYGKKNYCYMHNSRLRIFGDVFADIDIGGGSCVSLPTQRKILQAKPGFQYCRCCKKYKRTEKFVTLHQCRLCRRNIELEVKYGIDNKGYAELLEKQDGRCALCKTKDPGGRHKTFVVDHDHQTNEIRGLLCSDCNIGTMLDKIQGGEISIVRLTEYLSLSKTELKKVI